MSWAGLQPPPALRIASAALRRPWVAGLIAALALTPALQRPWGDLGISTHDLDPSWVIYELAFVGALLGALLGLRLADEWDWITSRRRPGEVLAHEAALIGVSMLAFVAPLLVWGLLGPWPAEPLAVAATLLALARPLVVGLTLRRLPLTPAGRALGLLALCWWIPAILTPSFPLGLGLVAHLATEPRGAAVLATSEPWAAETSMLLALLLAARLGLGSETRQS